ncbi:MAG: DEAD/DEAH box helicase family protein [Candidatus Thiodiazotropha sp.]
MSLIMIDGLKNIYRSGRDNLGSDLFSPCLKYCSEYKRAAGFFSSSALVSWAAGLPRIVADSGVKLRLIVSPELSEKDLNVLKEAAQSEVGEALVQDVIDDYLLRAIQYSESVDNVSLRLDLFGWLIKSGRLQLRLAIVNSENGEGLYHEKYGVFVFPESEKIAFIGSANESQQAHTRNGELILTFNSDNESDVSRIAELDEEFEEAWSGRVPGLTLYRPSEKVLDRLVKIGSRFINDRNGDQNADENDASRPPPWPHQQDAIDVFLSKKHGVLEMATGTGKTRTSLEIACALIRKNQIDAFVVTTDGNDLLRQWHGELLQWRATDHLWERVYRNFDRYKEREMFLLRPKGGCLVISRDSLPQLLSGLTKKNKERLLVIHDEVHGLGAPGKVSSLHKAHESVGYVLGLSATPEREYDDEGTAFIESEIGPVIYRFDLEDAIRAGILCGFNYEIIPYTLTDDDRARLKNVWAMKAARSAEGRPMSDAEVAIELSKVYKTAELKPVEFAEYLKANSNCLSNSIVFVETRDYGEAILPLIQRYTLKYKTYYAEDEVCHLEKFSRGELECLVTCHKLSQGIDIPHLQTVILFSSARARLETIQRIGRCLRVDRENPGKLAKVIDFVMRDDGDANEERNNPDLYRAQWLTQLSSIRAEN